MIAFNQNALLGQFIPNLITQAEVSAMHKALVDKFCELTGMVIFEELYLDVDESYQEKGFGHVFAVGYDGDPYPILWFGRQPYNTTNANNVYNVNEFEYGVIARHSGDEGDELVPPIWYKKSHGSTDNSRYFRTNSGSNPDDSSLGYLFNHNYTSSATNVYMAYVKADNGAIAFVLHLGYPIKNLSNSSYIIVMPLTNGTNTRMIAISPYTQGSVTEYELIFSAMPDLGLSGIMYDRIDYNHGSMIPTFVTVSYSVGNSTKKKSNFIKQTDGCMVTHRVYLPQECSQDWYIPEDIIYEAASINSLPSMGGITQYGNKRLLAFNYLSNGGFRLCMNVDAT